MNAAQSLRQLKSCLSQRLSQHDFAGGSGADVMWRKVHDAIVVIELQRDLKYSTKEHIRFTVNVGISLDALRESVNEEGAPASTHIPPPEKCHWRQRLGRLLPTDSDLWWTVSNELTAQVVCEEIASGLINFALPKVAAMANSEVLVRAWKEGRGQGLTEYERRVNLARLLIALDRTEEAELAVKALEDAAVGRPWAATATHEVGELRKKLR